MTEIDKNAGVAGQIEQFDRHLDKVLSMIVHHDEISLLAGVIKKVVHEKIGAGQWKKT